MTLKKWGGRNKLGVGGGGGRHPLRGGGGGGVLTLVLGTHCKTDLESWGCQCGLG